MTESKSMSIYREMNLLVLDDDTFILKLYEEFLKETFKSVSLLQDAQEALEKFSKQNYDLIISDYEMPMMDGLEFIKRIRQSNKTIPIIFVSSTQEYRVYQEALNLNVTHSLDKPFTKASLTKVLSEVIEPIFSYRASQRAKKEELNTLQNQKHYERQQQKQAFLKEHQAIRNDFYYRYYKHPAQKPLWYLDGSYKPHDILSGDTYSIRKLDGNRGFFFIIDAMGKGVSASVTSIVASSYLNHVIDLYDGSLDFKLLLEDFNSYITKNLLEEEVLATIFAELDFEKETLRVSSYGMPPILMCDHQNRITKIRTNNPPISVHNRSFNIDCHSIKEMQKILICSDGLVESRLGNGELYFSYLKEDFQASNTRSSFLQKLYTRVTEPNDDITLLFFQKHSLNPEAMVSLSCESRLEEVEKLVSGFQKYLQKHQVDPVHRAKLGMIFSEMMMNAYEHGSLDISNQKKKELVLQGALLKEYKERETRYGDRLIRVNYLIRPQGEGKCLTFDILDEGNGFDTKIFKRLIFDKTGVNGRGFKIAKKMTDAIYYSPKGNHVILHKYIPKES